MLLLGLVSRMTHSSEGAAWEVYVVVYVYLNYNVNPEFSN